jgi:hypothetical protein
MLNIHRLYFSSILLKWDKHPKTRNKPGWLRHCGGGSSGSGGGDGDDGVLLNLHFVYFN